MTGEGQRVVIAGLGDGVLERERRLPQPGGRLPAPGELVLLQSFLNSHFDLVDEWGADLLATPERLARWLSSRGLSDVEDPALRERDLRRVIGVREGLRQLARRNGDLAFRPQPGALSLMNEAIERVALQLGIDADALTVVPAGGGPVDRALGIVLAITARAMIDGGWLRLKACPGEHCGWVFYDHSRNNSGRWCSMAVCGGRTKARAHYRRQRGSSG